VKISSLKFLVRHIRGTQNVVADALSRMFEPSEVEETVEASCNLTTTNFPLAFHDLMKLQREDPELSEIRNRIRRGEKVVNYLLRNEVLYWRARRSRKLQLVIPTVAREMIFSYFHDSPLGGHLDACKTLNKIRQHFAWHGMNREIRAKVRACHTCLVSKLAQSTRWGFLSSSVAERPMQ